MDFQAATRRSTLTKKRPPSTTPDPALEPPSKVAAAPPSATAISDQIWTPEKPIQLPRRGRSRSVAFSVKEVRRVALGLQRATDRSDLSHPGNDLSAVEEQLGAGSGSGSSLKSPKAKIPIKLPKKYEILCEFFNCMESSIRLLRLKGIVSTFQNILTSIQNLTERRFTHAHLAQLKFIMPEAIMIKKVLSHDEAICCMKPELQVTLQVDAVTKNIKGKSESGYSILRKVFRERIVDFFKDHPEGDEVPEDQLPHPFNQTKPNILPNVSAKAACTESSSSIASQQQFLVPSHMPQSFQRRFSQKLPIPSSGKTPLMCSSKDCPKDTVPVSIVSSPIKCTSRPPIFKKSLLGSPFSTASSSKYGAAEESAQKLVTADDSPHKEPYVQQGTPAKLVSTPLRLMSNTPEIPTPKRCPTSPICDYPPVNKSAKRSTRTKLFMTPKKSAKAGDEEYENRSLPADDDVLSILPESLLQSIREKEQKAAQEKEAGYANAVRRQKLIASLPNTFDMILLIFQSWKRSVMTKQELIYKLISSHCKIVDRGEVEEQFKLLLELVPDWISEKTAYSGDILCCVSKLSNPDEVRQRLSEAE